MSERKKDPRIVQLEADGYQRSGDRVFLADKAHILTRLDAYKRAGLEAEMVQRQSGMGGLQICEIWIRGEGRLSTILTGEMVRWRRFVAGRYPEFVMQHFGEVGVVTQDGSGTADLDWVCVQFEKTDKDPAGWVWVQIEDLDKTTGETPY